MKIWIALLSVMCSLTASAVSEQTESKSLSIKSTGFIQVDAGEGSGDTVRRIRPLVTLKGEKWGAVLEFEFAKTDFFNEDTGNWIEKAYIFRDISENTQLRAGRLFLAAQTSTPMPANLKTINFWSAPFATFAYGAQVTHTWDDWSMVVDLTGSSGKDFYDTEQFDRIESSGRFKRTTSDTFAHSVVYQVSEDFLRLGADMDWIISPKFNLFNGLYYRDESALGLDDGLSGVTLIEWVPVTQIRPHFQLDFRPDGEVEYTAGIGFYFNESWRFTADYEESNGILTRLQCRW